jgi:hypothetical protein
VKISCGVKLSTRFQLTRASYYYCLGISRVIYCLLFTAFFPFILLTSSSYHLNRWSCPTTRHGGVWGERSYSSYSSALDGGEWSASRPGRALSPGKRTPGTHCTGGWVGPRAGLDTEVRGKKLYLCRGSNPGRPASSQTLHWLSYPAHLIYHLGGLISDTHRTSLSSGKYSCFVYGRSRAQVSARRPANLTEGFRGFRQSPGEGRVSTLKIGHDRFLPNPFQFIIHLSSFHSTLYSLSYWKGVVK